MNAHVFGMSLVAASLLATSALTGDAQTPSPLQIKNIVLVHGAWADGSSWSKIVPLLQARGFHVVCTQNPLTSIADDVAVTNRIIDAQDGPVLLVGHSYGGAIITRLATIQRSQGWSMLSRSRPMREKLSLL
jgi:pimeloyl-ACP methyl ester carboxylesterase